MRKCYKYLATRRLVFIFRAERHCDKVSGKNLIWPLGGQLNFYVANEKGPEKVKMRQHVPTRRKFHSRVSDSGNEIANVENEKCENSEKKRYSVSRFFFTSFHKRYQANTEILNVILFFSDILKNIVVSNLPFLS